jgi:hypothetical protein
MGRRCNMANIINCEVFNRREGTKGVVVAENADTVTIQFEDVDGNPVKKTVTQATFRRWYNVVSVSEEPPKGQTQGRELRDRFMKILVGYCDGIEVFYDEKRNVEYAKYRGKHIFEISYTKRHLNVMCHPKSLAPQNLAKAYRTFPKEWNWSLRTKFVFTSLGEAPLMKSIIADGIYYRTANRTNL